MKTKVTELFEIEHPIIQGGMRFVRFAELAAAVSNAGGLGIITGLTQGTPPGFVRSSRHWPISRSRASLPSRRCPKSREAARRGASQPKHRPSPLLSYYGRESVWNVRAALETGCPQPAAAV